MTESFRPFGTFTVFGTAGKWTRACFYLSIFVSTMLCIAGVAYGLWFVLTRGPYKALIEPQLYVDVGLILVVIGALAIINNLTFIYAFQKQLRCLLYTCAVASVIIFVMLLIGGVIGFVFRQKLTKQVPLDVKMLTSLKELYGSERHQDQTKAWDMVQKSLQCCGVNEANDLGAWKKSKWYMRLKPKNDSLKRIVPASCCRPGKNCSSVDPSNPDRSLVFTDTCFEPLRRDLLSGALVAAILGIVASISLLFPTVFGAAFAKLIQR